LDNLCGIYSLINATRIVVGNSLDLNACEKLLVKCLSAIEHKQCPLNILSQGTGIYNIGYAIDNVIRKKYSVKKSKPFHRDGNVSLNEYWTCIRTFLNNSKNRAVILGIESLSYSHWTVVCKATPKQLILFDSDKMKTISRGRCSVKKFTKSRPICMFPAATYFLSK